MKIFLIYVSLITIGILINATNVVANTIVCKENLYYSLDDQSLTAMVVMPNGDHGYFNYNKTRGRISIPKTINHEGKTYSVTAVDDKCFKDSYIREVVISSNMDIGDESFADMPNLYRIIIDSDTPPSVSATSFGKDKFSATFETRLYVNEDNLDYYRSTQPWSNFYEVNNKMDMPCNWSFDRTWAREINGIKYYLDNDNQTACVANSGEYRNDDPEAGRELFYEGRDLVVPESFEYSGLTYTVTHVDSYTFYHTLVNEVVLPETITTLGDFAFYASGGDFKLPTSVKSLGSSLFVNTFTPDIVEWPSAYEVIPDSTFYACEFMTNIILPDNLKRIKRGAFEWCESLEKIELPADLERIDTHAFASCPLKEVVVKCNVPPLTAANAFDKLEYWSINGYTQSSSYAANPLDATLKVPKKDIDYYRTTEPWCNFKEILEIEEAKVENIDDISENIIYTISGVKIHEGELNSNELPKGIYIVRSNGKVMKIVM